MPTDTKLQRMRRAIARLPEPIATIYRLHLVDGLDYRSVAALTTLDVADVERCIARAIVLIDRYLRAQERRRSR